MSNLIGMYRDVAPIVDAIIVFFLIYRVFVLIKGTRAVPMLIGLLALILLYFVSQESVLGLATFNWILEKFIGSLFLIVVVVFQADIRRALVAFGGAQFLSNFRSAAQAQVLDEIVKVSFQLSAQKIGALMIIERDANLDAYMEDAVKIDARVTKELVYSIFVPDRQNPLHDGAVIIRGGRLAAGGVFLPMSGNPRLDRAFGTRHRAALGISEETDAVVVAVSEERGIVSVAVDGRLEEASTDEWLRARLSELLLRKVSLAIPRIPPASDPPPPASN
ncbi:MAG: TIGR00159 family protein [Myxococcales bacterium]|nr:TIGR00159 family protein [Myxococcales bacterium]